MRKVQNYCFLPVFIAASMMIGCQESSAKKASKTTPAQISEKIAQPAAQPQMSTAVKKKAEPKPAETAKGPKIIVTKEYHDFGEVGPGSNNVCDFTFKNVGTETLQIERVQSTCGCSVPQLKKNDYAPGETGTVEVRFHAPTHKGETKKQLYIISNDTSNPRAQIELHAIVSVKVEVNPEEVSLKLDKPNAGMGDLTVKGLDDQKFSITRVMTTNNVITCDFDPAKKDTEFVLHPVVNMDLLAKNLNGVLQIEVNHPQGGTLLVRYTTLAQYEVNRPRIILQNAKPGETDLKDVMITSNYGNSLKITSAESRLGYMKIANQEIEGNILKLGIEITTPNQDATAKRYFSDELKIKFENNDEVSIRVSGWFKN